MALVLAACAVGPDYRAPAVTPGAAYLNAGAASVNAAAPGADITRFWRGFEDPVLSQLVERALGANGDVRIAQARLRESRALLQGTRAELLPEVGTTAGAARSLTPEYLQPGSSRSERTATVYDAGFTANWELDFFGRNRRASESAAAQLDASAAGVAAVGTSIAAEVARNYLELRGLQQRQQVADEAIANQRESLRLTEARLEFGRGTRLDVARARSQLGSTEATLPALRPRSSAPRTGSQPSRRRRQARSSTNSPEVRGAALPSGHGPRGSPDRDSGAAAASPSRPHPRREGARRCTANIGVATADLFPRGEPLRPDRPRWPAPGFAPRQRLATVLVGRRAHVAAVGLRPVRSRISASEARAEQALAGYEQSVALALEEAEGALTQFTRNAQQSERLLGAAREAEDASRLAALRFNAGSADFLAVLDAQRQALTLRDTLVQARTARLLRWLPSTGHSVAAGRRMRPRSRAVDCRIRLELLTCCCWVIRTGRCCRRGQARAVRSRRSHLDIG
jgi:multidrug efflux system outer membrane protein